MPNLQPVVAGQDRFAVRLVGPKAAVWPSAPESVQQFAVLNAATMVARPLPYSDVPGSPDLISGSWTGRLGDAGELALQFPNVPASDGVPWRQRFDPTGHLQFLEVYFNGFLDAVGVIDQVQASQQAVAVHTYDGFWLLKKAYTRDWTFTGAPRDVIERATQVWMPSTVDDFPPSSSISGSTLTTPNGIWTIIASSGASVTLAGGGGLALSVPSAISQASVKSAAMNLTGTGAWRAIATELRANTLGTNSLQLTVTESTGDLYFIDFQGTSATLYGNFSGVNLVFATATLPTAASYALMLESDGEWVAGYVNGLLVGMMRRADALTSSITTSVALQGDGSAVTSVVVASVIAESAQPFLMRGTDKGDYVLPGDSTTYPYGGLHARYSNDLDLAANANRLSIIGAPSRSLAWGGNAGATAEYQNQQDPTINGQANPTPGAATTNWSCVWFGSVYLKLSAGNYTLQINFPAVADTCMVRAWVGKTMFGDQLVDAWSLSNASGATFSFTVSAAALAGSMPYGGGTVQRDGWYPIRIEYAVDATAASAPALYFTNVPAAYTDPGGTAIASGAQATIVPSTSLSPLGCAAQRYQGVSHFDLAQQTAQTFGYQIALEPQQLESGLFPGVLAPRIREGHDTDLVLSPDVGPRTDGEGVLNYSSTLDASDFATSLWGNGAGVQTGTSGQLQAEVFDAPTMLAALFDAQQWSDHSDASFEELLHALLNSELGLRLAPWQLLSADPTGRPRRAYSWPLPGALSQMRWRPGDGLRVQALDINVDDTTPRQLLVITRNFAPGGIMSSTATFSDRPA